MMTTLTVFALTLTLVAGALLHRDSREIFGFVWPAWLITFTALGTVLLTATYYGGL